MPAHSTSQTWDAAIIGGGLAGCCLAWQLHFRGCRPLLLDAGEPVTASKIAAGLITPITGKRMAESWQVSVFLPQAVKFYGQVESLLGEKFFHPRTALRLLRDPVEAEHWAARKERSEFQNHLLEWPSALPGGLADAGHGGFAMKTYRLNVPKFLELTHAWFAAQGQFRTERVDVSAIALGPEIIALPLADETSARHVIFCQGYTTQPVPQFSWVPFKAARGDILTIRLPGHGLEQTDIHAGGWLAPLDGDHFLLGSTYDWHDLTATPSEVGKAELLAKLARLLPGKAQACEVIRHAAAVRPIIRESRGMLGTHPVVPQFHYFNGLGSKGSLHGPALASFLAEHLMYGRELPPEHDLREN